MTEKGNKKATINSINVDDKFFQYAAAVALNHGEISKICKELKKKSLLYSIILQEKVDWKKFKKNNPAVSFNVLYVKKMYIYPVYISKHNPNYEKQIILLIILNGEGWHYLAVKKLWALLAGITSKHHGDLY